jgi:hypothetical protein
LSRYTVTGRNGRVVHEDIDEVRLHAWMNALDGLARSGALTKPEKFAIQDESGRITNWRPSPMPAAAVREA